MPDETAMLLTQQEWEDLAHMVEHYRACTTWLENPKQRNDALTVNTTNVQALERRRTLAARIIDAAEI